MGSARTATLRGSRGGRVSGGEWTSGGSTDTPHCLAHSCGARWAGRVPAMMRHGGPGARGAITVCAGPPIRSLHPGDTISGCRFSRWPSGTDRSMHGRSAGAAGPIRMPRLPLSRPAACGRADDRTPSGPRAAVGRGRRARDRIVPAPAAASAEAACRRGRWRRRDHGRASQPDACEERPGLRSFQERAAECVGRNLRRSRA